MDFAFDPDKSRSNEERHGVSLSWATSLWDESHIIMSAKSSSGEARDFILAKPGGKCYVAVFTMRGDVVRIISCHRADRRLERIYENITAKAKSS